MGGFEQLNTHLGRGGVSVRAANLPGVALVRVDFTVSGNVLVQGGESGNRMTVSGSQAEGVTVAGLPTTVVTTGGSLFQIFGGVGDDVVDAARLDADAVINVQSMQGDDTLIGHAGSDQLIGGEGDDRLEGRGGAGDRLVGGPGNNIIIP